MKNTKLLGGVAAVAAAGTLGVGLYLAAPAFAGAPGATPSPSDDARHDHRDGRHGRHDMPPGRHGMRDRFGMGVHGQATVRRGNGFAQLDWQRGQVTAVGAGTLTVRSADGATWQWRTDQDTRVRKAGQQSSAGRLAKNDFVVVFGPDDKGVRTARHVIVPRNVPPRATQTPSQPPSPSPS